MHHQAALTELLNRLTGLHLPDYVVMMLFVMTVTLGLAFVFTRGMSVDRPRHGQQVLELVVSTLRNMLTDLIPHHGEKYLGWVGCFTVFILFGNLLGEIPWFNAPTGYWLLTMALGTSSLLIFTWLGIRDTGWYYSLHFFGPVLPTSMVMKRDVLFWKKGNNFSFPFLFILFMGLEPISHMARAFSLSLRLFANISGDHMVAGTFEGLVPALVPVPFMMLGILTAIVQTFIFTILTIVFISLAVEHH